MKKSPFTVAIVDDNMFMRESARLRLSILGYTVVMEAENGQELLKLLSAGAAPDICLLDINMPVMDGIETAKNLEQNWPAIRILFHSMEKIGDYAAINLRRCGFVPKDASSRDFNKALLSLMDHFPERDS